MATGSRQKKKRRPQWIALLLAAVRTGVSITKACDMAKVSRRRVYNYRDKDPEFKQELEDAYDDGTDTLEAEAQRRAVDGIDTPVIYQGEIHATYKTYSDSLLMFLLKSRNAKYKERHEHTGPGGTPLVPDTIKIVHE